MYSKNQDYSEHLNKSVYSTFFYFMYSVYNKDPSAVLSAWIAATSDIDILQK